MYLRVIHRQQRALVEQILHHIRGGTLSGVSGILLKGEA
jgi:hypothetical protein